MSSRRREYVVLVATLLLCFAGAELVARSVVPAPLAWRYPQTLYERSASLGFRLKRDQVAYTADKRFQTNAMGLRGPAHPWHKAAGVHRTLVLGDSIAFGYGVAYEDAFPKKLENLLNSARPPAVTFEVVDSGVPGFNTLQEVSYFKDEGVRLDPDAVILAFCWNDIADKSRVAIDDEGRMVDETTSRNPGRLARWSETKAGYGLRNLLKSSAFLYFVVDRVRGLRAGHEVAVSGTLAMQRAVLSGTVSPAVASGLAQVDEQLRVLAEISAARGIPLLVAILPMPQVLEGRSAPDALYPSAIARLCQKHGVQYLDLLPAFAREFKGHTSLFIPYDGDHPNERGHQVIAESLAATLHPHLLSRR